jgi:hypothetical protein
MISEVKLYLNCILLKSVGAIVFRDVWGSFNEIVLDSKPKN